MPEISRFFGIIITIYWKDHGSPTSMPNIRNIAPFSQSRTVAYWKDSSQDEPWVWFPSGRPLIGRNYSKTGI